MAEAPKEIGKVMFCLVQSVQQREEIHLVWVKTAQDEAFIMSVHKTSSGAHTMAVKVKDANPRWDTWVETKELLR